MKREWIAFACAVVCLIAVPVVINALVSRLDGTFTEKRGAAAFLYFCGCVVLLVTIFCLWLLD